MMKLKRARRDSTNGASLPHPAPARYQPRAIAESGRTLRGVRSLGLLAIALLSGHPASAQFSRTLVKAFCVEDKMGLQPFAGVIQGSDGALYGTTLLGAGSPEGVPGVVYKLNADGTGYQVLHRFSNLGSDGMNPYGGLIEGRDQRLYGTTRYGGSSNLGTVFRVNKDGGEYSIVHHFGTVSSDGAFPYSGLVETSDGALVGTTFNGGISNRGVIFRLSPDGAAYQLTHQFTGANGDGGQSPATLIRGSEGSLYGITYLGGSSDLGTVFKLNEDGGGYNVIHAFSNSGGSGLLPFGPLLEGADNRLYGTTTGGGASNLGTVFRVDKDGNNHTVLHSFTSTGVTGAQPYGNLIQGIDGALYGTTASAGASNQGAVFRVETNGTAPTAIHTFNALPSDGAVPQAGLIRGNDGLFYGTTYQGGSNNLGTVFRVQPDGLDFAVIRSFVGEAGDAANPYANVVEGSDAVLYGTTYYGGDRNAGSIYRINRNGGGYGVIHGFTGTAADGANPYARVIEASDHLLYGTTTGGGKSNLGTVFRVNRDGTGYTNLHSFSTVGGSGIRPYGSVIEGADNRLYGTLVAGGAFDRGGLFRMNRDGSVFTVLYTFTGTTVSGALPYAGLIQGSDGALYTTTAYGGTSNLGTVFRIAASGAAPTVLRSFTGAGGDGATPFAGLCRGSDGILYGVTYAGGTNNLGTVFKINTNGTGYLVLHRFTGGPDGGASPSTGGPLVEGADGSLYGTTFAGGESNLGTVFKLKRDGSGFAVLFSFSAADGLGANPYAGLTRTRDGALLGTSLYGGTGCGTLLQIVPEASFGITADRTTTLSGPAGYRFLVQWIDGLAAAGTWLDLTNLTLLDTPVPLPAPSGGSGDQRYYRAVLNP